MQADFYKWASTTLTEKELEEFNSAVEDNNRLMQSYVSNGSVTFHPLYKEVYINALSETCSILLSTETIINQPDLQLTSAKLAQWLNRFYNENDIKVD